jgi:hypothetical protein
MRITDNARKVLKLRVWTGLLVMLLLVSAELWMLCSLGSRCTQVSTQPPVQVPAIGDLFAAR